jgi:hypothetical protein
MDETAAAGAAEAPPQTDIVERVAGGQGPLTARDAAHSLLDARHKQTARERRGDDKDNETDDERARDSAVPAQESSPGAEPGHDAGPETAPGEGRGDDRAEVPPIEPPRSWTKEDKELFKGLPRETQERLAERERSRESDFLRRQNEAADKLRGLSVKEQAVDQAKRQYEAALPVLLQTLQQQQAGEFADVKSIADIDRLAREDWPRYVLWDAQQKKIAAVQQQVNAALSRQAQAAQHHWSSFAQQQDALFLEKAPELGEKGQMAKVAETAAGMLKDLGFNDQELSDLWNGRQGLSLRDHRVQLMLRDGVRYRDAQAAAKSAAARPVPQVQRPGAAPPRNAEADARLSALNSRLEQSGTLKDAAALLVAQRQARARR